MPGVGVAYGAWQGGVEADVLTRLRARCEAVGGALVIEKAALEVKQSLDVWGRIPADFALMQRIKQEMDPNRVLNPGRFVGGI
jgi:glycolate oxidase FAD binding subunit